ncbi:SusC/RagA family TonB-linked outer membrane protein [Chitinophaga sp. RAB17]|uniref:SusC/RagA family TonB-linked outer membrane protein n=1 Tax=Chitinophaga sp. RAB17 TaxID=3233049 RepID=UPI003F8F6374
MMHFTPTRCRCLSDKLFRWCLSVIPAVILSTPAMAFTKDTTARHIKPAKDSSWFSYTTWLWNRNSSRANMVAATSSVYSQEVGSTPVADITNVLAGRMAGLYTLQLSGMNGADGASFSLRGKTPLIVIDGVVRDFTGFNPNDIESVTLLKDALATAMYGQRSSNGVLMVTTREKGRKAFEINASAQYGLLESLYKPQYADAFHYAQLYNEAQHNMNAAATPRYSDDMMNAWKNHTNDPYKQPDVNWYNEIIRHTTSQQRYNIDLAGNASNYHYYASLEHFAQSGNFITSPANSYNTNNDYKRYNIRTNALVNFNKNIELGLNVFGSVASGNQPGIGTAALMSLTGSTPPVAFPVFNANGSFGGTNLWRTNPYAGAISSGYQQTTERTISADMTLQYKLDDLLKGLWIKGQLSMNNYYMETIDRSKGVAVYEPDTTAGAIPNSYIQYGTDGLVAGGQAKVNSQVRQNYYNIMAGYDHTWNGHSLRLLATYNVDNTIRSFTQLNTLYSNAGLTASYDWHKTYLAELGLVYGTLNRYTPGKRGSFLPSAGLAWVISNEHFFASNIFDRLKIRATAGQTAWGDPNNYFLYLPNYVTGSTGYNVGETSSGVSGTIESQLANPDITWEKAWKLDVGLEAALFHSQLSVSLDYYRNKYYDQLQTRGRNSGILGHSYPLENIGRSRYSGLEASVNYSPVTTHTFKYYLDGNVSIAASSLLYNGDPIYPYAWQNKTGLPVGQAFGLVADGFYQTGTDVSKTANWQGYTPAPGDIRYKDLNGDGVINVLDMQPIGNQRPMIFFGMGGGFSWKGFDFKLLLQGVMNRNMVLSATSVSAFNNSYGNVMDMHNNRWTPENAVNAVFPRLTIGTNVNNSQASTFWMRNGNYLRLKNVELGYDFKKILLPHSRVSHLRLFVNAYNLFTWKKVDWFDPESGMSAFSNQRIINGGISLGL